MTLKGVFLLDLSLLWSLKRGDDITLPLADLIVDSLSVPIFPEFTVLSSEERLYRLWNGNL